MRRKWCRKRYRELWRKRSVKWSDDVENFLSSKAWHWRIDSVFECEQCMVWMLLTKFVICEYYPIEILILWKWTALFIHRRTTEHMPNWWWLRRLRDTRRFCGVRPALTNSTQFDWISFNNTAFCMILRQNRLKYAFHSSGSITICYYYHQFYRLLCPQRVALLRYRSN